MIPGLRHWCGVLAWGLILTIQTASQAAFEFNDSEWQGTSGLLELARERLGKHRVELVATLDWNELQPADALLVLHPTVDLDFGEASAFLRAGGRIALLDDYGNGPALFEHFQIRRIRAPLKPARMLRENPGLAIAIPAVQVVAGQEQGRHPVVANVDQVITNHPSALTHPNLTPVLTIPAVDEPDTSLAVTGIIAGKGRLLVMGDPSTLINLMLRYPGNRAFAQGLVEYLVENDTWGERGGTLYLLANDFKQRGRYGGGSSVLQELRDIGQGLREMVADVRRDGLPDAIAFLLGALAALGAVLWAGLSVTRPYRRTPPRYARAQPILAQGGAAGRAAVLSAPTTHRALALLELKSALDERLSLELGLEPDPTPKTVLGEIVRQGVLSRRSLALLETMLAKLKQVEDAVATGRSIRVRIRDVERMRRDVDLVLEEVRHHTGDPA